MKNRVAFVVCLIMAIWLANSVSQANWYAAQRNNEGLVFLSEGSTDDAIKAFKDAILSYESYERCKFSPERAPLYFNLARACYAKMQEFPLLSRGYEYYWRMGLVTSQQAVDIQFKQPQVSNYFNARPVDLFETTLDSGCREVQDFLKMRDLVDKFQNAKRMAMFEKCVNSGPSPASNIMTIGPTEFSPGGVLEPKQVKGPEGPPSAEQGGGAANPTQKPGQDTGKTKPKTGAGAQDTGKTKPTTDAGGDKDNEGK